MQPYFITLSGPAFCGSLRRALGLAASVLIVASVEVAAAGLQWPPSGKVDRMAPDPVTRNFYVVLDGSGSMNERACRGDGRKIDQAKAALEVFSKAVPRNVNLGLLVFDRRGVSERVALATDNRQAFMQQVLATNPSGGTPLRGAIALARLRLEEQGRRQLGYGEYNLVVVTDGEASSGQDPRQEVNDMLARSPIIVHTIGFCISSNHSLNQAGRTVYKAANDRADLERGLEAALAEAPKFTADRFTGTR
ncbi:MAG: VWA domain-containing protein [Betaproteobacteria bacterium]|nr:VWA domain-containing protein [Betaproteobacteria bacterium]